MEYNHKEIEKYRQVINKLKKSLNKEAWDGRWYKRAINDEGEEKESKVKPSFEIELDGPRFIVE